MLSFRQFIVEEPKILKRLVSQLKAKGMDTSKAYPVAISRAAKYSDRNEKEFVYSSKTNRATLKNK